MAPGIARDPGGEGENRGGSLAGGQRGRGGGTVARERFPATDPLKADEPVDPIEPRSESGCGPVGREPVDRARANREWTR